MFERVAIVLQAFLLLAIGSAAWAVTAPGEAYPQLHTAELAATSYADLVALRSKASVAKDPPASDEDKKMMFELLHATLPKIVRVESEKMDGAKATLVVSSPGEENLKPGDSDSVKGTIELVLEDGSWKLERESWESKLLRH